MCFQVQPGDALFGMSISADSENAAAIPYDVGTPEECGVTTLVTFTGPMQEIVPSSVTQLDEYWIMSYQVELSQWKTRNISTPGHFYFLSIVPSHVNMVSEMFYIPQ